MQTVAKEINEDLIKVQEWLYCNKLSLNVLKTHYMIIYIKKQMCKWCRYSN